MVSTLRKQKSSLDKVPLAFDSFSDSVEFSDVTVHEECLGEEICLFHLFDIVSLILLEIKKNIHRHLSNRRFCRAFLYSTPI